MRADFFGRIASPANRALAGSSSRSSTWETLRVAVSLSASRDSSHEAAGIDLRAGVAGRAGQGGKVQGGQVGDGQQQPGEPGGGRGGEGGEVDDLGAGQVGVPPGSGRADAGLGLGVAQQPPEAFLGQDLPDAGAVQRPALGRQPRADLVDRQALAAQLDDLAAGGVLLRRALAAGPARLREQRELARPEVADQRRQRRRRVPEPGGGLGQRRALRARRRGPPRTAAGSRSAGRANASQPRRCGAGFAVMLLVYHVHCCMSRT